MLFFNNTKTVYADNTEEELLKSLSFETSWEKPMEKCKRAITLKS